MSKVAFTAGRVTGFTCPPEKKQAFLWDATAAGLGLRATPAGKPAYIFQAVYQGKDVRLTIGSPENWTIPKAQEKARELQRMIDEGKDPRSLKADALAQSKAAATEQAQQALQEAAQALTVGEVWQDYIEKRRPFWGDLHYRDHQDKASPGGLPSKRNGAKDELTKPGPLAELMPLALCDLDQAKIEAWAAGEGITRATSARLAFRLMSVFLNWCAEQPEYANLIPQRNPTKTKKAKEALGKPNVKSDVLQKGQLNAWFTVVRQIPNQTISAFLQVLLLTGARLNEVQTMRWENVDTQWKGLTINDKMEGTRTVPLTPYVERLITALPRHNAYVFASSRLLSMSDKNVERRAAKSAKRGKPAPVGEVLETSETGFISEPNTPHTRACRAAGLDGLTLHGLRRSFASLCEWLDIPGGVSAQIQGHAPHGVREQNYIRRPLDLLRVHHEKIEAWILEQAGVKFDAKVKPGKLRAVAG